MREDEVHYAARQFLRNQGWTLVAGQYPNGSDDELPILNVKDPRVSCDNSPDPRRHALDKLVPDLVALRSDTVLMVEMKPKYDPGDEMKLNYMLGERFENLVTALEELSSRSGRLNGTDWRNLRYLPALGFCPHRFKWVHKKGFALLLVESLTSVRIQMPEFP